MKGLVRVLSFFGLGLTIIPSTMVIAGSMDLETNKNLMAIGMLIWFAAAPFWINKKKSTGKSTN